MKRRVLLTGASGFVGLPTARALAALPEIEVHSLCRSALPPLAGVVPHRGDLLSDSLRPLLDTIRPKILVHLAWYAEPGAFWNSPRNLDWVAASVRLFRAFADSGGRRIVSVGTCAEYDWSDGVCREGVTPLRPATLYGVCKNATREVLEAFGREEGLTTAWARLFHLYGPREDVRRLVASLASALLAGREAPCSSGEQARDFLHVEDAATLLARLAISDATGAFNVGSGQAVPVRQVCETVARLAGRPDLLRAGKVATRSGEPALLVADMTRARRELAWSPDFDLETGLALTVAWWHDFLASQER